MTKTSKKSTSTKKKETKKKSKADSKEWEQHDVEEAENKECPFCAEEIKADAKKCKHCGEILDEDMRKEREKQTSSQNQKWNPGVAAVLSLVIPGAGQMYKGQIGNGLAWLLFVVLGYMFLIVPGLILHILCIVGAASGDTSK